VRHRGSPLATGARASIADVEQVIGAEQRELHSGKGQHRHPPGRAVQRRQEGQADRCLEARHVSQVVAVEGPEGPDRGVEGVRGDCHEDRQRELDGGEGGDAHCERSRGKRGSRRGSPVIFAD
jgi:hypothetical protein